MDNYRQYGAALLPLMKPVSMKKMLIKSFSISKECVYFKHFFESYHI